MNMRAQLILHDLQVQANIGWTDEERNTPQTLLVSVEIHYASLPLACTTDELSQTLCYHQLCNQIHEFTESISFRLIETFNHALYQFILALLPQETRLKLSVKKFPTIKGLSQGVSFILSEDTIV